MSARVEAVTSRVGSSLIKRYSRPTGHLLASYQHMYVYLYTLAFMTSPMLQFFDAEQHIAIVGGGITGLACAYYITKYYPAAKITIYEKSSRFGGWLLSERTQVDSDGGTILFEAGPRSLRPIGNGALSLSMLSDLDLLDDTIWTSRSSPAATRRYIYYPDHLVCLLGPPAPGWLADIWKTLTTEPLFEGFLSSVFTEAFRTSRHEDLTDESIAQFIGRRLGPKLPERVLSAVFHGIYAGDINRLSAKSLTKTLWETEGEYGSFMASALLGPFRRPKLPPKRERAFMQALTELPVIPQHLADKIRMSSVFTFRNGLSQFSDGLFGYLYGRPKTNFRHSTTVQSMIKREDGKIDVATRTESAGKSSGESTSTHTHVIWTATPEHLAQYAEDTAPISKELSSIPFESVMTVNLYYSTPDLNPPGFGYLIPLAVPIEQNPENALGVVFDNSYAPDPAFDDDDIQGPAQDTVKKRGTKLTVMLGGHYWRSWPQYPTEEEGLQMAKSVLRRHLKITEEPIASRVNFNANCIPQYLVGHETRLNKIHDGLLTEYGGALRVAGSWINGVGVNDCLRSAWNTVDDLKTTRASGLESIVTP
ncbi:protoporphyrinogen oxidase [Sphaceloma murrayae]|uniref:Protoporphyrinogen oxidase n=1 Tax=Sphaceloma murrayae TaxID=2082308 RepID=A0A2K1R061_9PEZI|nr:protoporphyrinogen oxidase [Sphaceloma murrayae]